MREKQEIRRIEIGIIQLVVVVFTKEIKKTESVYDSVVDEGDCCMFTGGCSWNPVG